MSRVITFSRNYPPYHPRKGEATYFVEKLWNTLFALNGFVMSYKILCDLNSKLSPDILWPFWISIERGNEELKGHTIRVGHRFKVGEWFSPRVWSGKPYNSKQIIIGPDIQVKKTWLFEMTPALWADECIYKISGERISAKKLTELASNDGLGVSDFIHWFAGPNMASSKRKSFTGQVICWNKNIKY